LAVGLSDRAVGALEAAIGLGGEHIALEAYESLAATYRQLGNYPKALEAHQHVLDARPSDAQVLLGLASLHSEFGRNAEAIDAYQRVLGNASTGTAAYEAYASLGHIYAGLDRVPEAVAGRYTPGRG
jgi:tetratricopeptide (TPR) repeat protein